MPSNTCYFMLAINIDKLVGMDAYHAAMERFRAEIKASPMWDKTKEMLIPGELEYRCEQTRMKEGVPIPYSVYEQLKSVAAELKLKTALQPL